jgi:caspase domain-containing protein
VEKEIRLGGVEKVETSLDPEEEHESERHLVTLTTFKDDLRECWDSILKNRTEYTKVIAVVAYWQNARNLAHTRTSANTLATTFKNDYGFNVAVPYEISRQSDNFSFATDLHQYFKSILNDRRCLLVLYYGGHASPMIDERIFWRAENETTAPKIDWLMVQRLLFEKQNVTCDKLFIFDCCHAGRGHD